MKIRMLLILMLGGYLALFFPYSAHALDCAEPGPVTDEIDRSSIIFMGKAVTVNREGLTLFQVQTAWKGVDPNYTQIEIYSNGWDSYEPGQFYLVFGGQREKKLQTHLCGHSGLWDATKELVMQNAGLQPILINGETKEIAQSSSTESDIAVLAIIFGLVIAAIGAMMWFAFVRRRKRP